MVNGLGKRRLSLETPAILFSKTKGRNHPIRAQSIQLRKFEIAKHENKDCGAISCIFTATSISPAQ